MRAALAFGLALVSLLLDAGQEGRAEPPAGPPLAITVNPSGYAAGPETLDQKLARRDRESEYLFRHICRDCGGRSGEPGASFDPQSALDGARRAR
ncbi:hypothetical protein [Enterovirga sp.]|uniref:hypothetical protein n=1 Tax=Enterovirga sp. TaxID=2026350 RepID=UPI0026134736|nr:hypothetical protein [Enterovirga sp.]MDB5590814.1 hypothetical protein [Enterovirga sp.]